MADYVGGGRGRGRTAARDGGWAVRRSPQGSDTAWPVSATTRSPGLNCRQAGRHTPCMRARDLTQCHISIPHRSSQAREHRKKVEVCQYPHAQSTVLTTQMGHAVLSTCIKNIEAGVVTGVQSVCSMNVEKRPLQAHLAVRVRLQHHSGNVAPKDLHTRDTSLQQIVASSKHCTYTVKRVTGKEGPRLGPDTTRHTCGIFTMPLGSQPCTWGGVRHVSAWTRRWRNTVSSGQPRAKWNARAALLPRPTPGAHAPSAHGSPRR